eukprot:8195256-Ditylum_brightwellii.AAC.1
MGGFGMEKFCIWGYLKDLNDLRPMKEYVGCKNDHNTEKRYIKITQSVLIKSLENEFNLDEHGNMPKIPAEPGTVLNKGEGW